MSKRKTVSRRVVGRKVVGSANPAAKWGRGAKRTCLDSIGGFFVGLLLFFLPFYLTYNAATTEKDSKDISRLTVISAAEAGDVSGKAFVSGKVTASEKLEPPMGAAEGSILAYDYKLERYETKTVTRQETETRTEGGQEVEYTYEVEEEVSDWVTDDSELKWAGVYIGQIKIDPKRCEIQLPWVSTFDDEYTDAMTGEKIRESVNVIKGDIQASLFAEFENGKVVDQPDFYILTTKTQEELVSQKHSQEESKRWMMIVFAVIVMTISFNLMLGPAMILINIIPVRQIGGAIRFVITLVSLIISCVIVAATYAFVRFWWVIVVLLIALAVWIVIEANKKREASPELEPDALEE